MFGSLSPGEEEFAKSLEIERYSPEAIEAREKADRIRVLQDNFRKNGEKMEQEKRIAVLKELMADPVEREKLVAALADCDPSPPPPRPTAAEYVMRGLSPAEAEFAAQLKIIR